MGKFLVINADDFGLCDGVNRGIAKAHTEGVLTSATIMANMPAAEEAVKIAKQLPSLGVGVHLNLSAGRPLSGDSGAELVGDSGEFIHSPAKLWFLSVVSGGIRDAIRAELKAQIQWVMDNGIRPTHLDSHKHIHNFPVIFHMVCDMARQFNIAAIRNSFEPKAVLKMPWPLLGEGGRQRTRLLRHCARINRLQNRRFFKTGALFGIAHTGRIDVSFFKSVAMYNAVQTAEVMTHPGFTDGLDPNKTRLIQQRKVELDALCSNKTRQILNDNGIKLGSYGQI